MTLLDEIKYQQAEQYRAILRDKIPPGAVVPAHSEDGHFYLVDKLGIKLPSVTGALQVIKDPSIQNWKMNRALEYAWDVLSRTDAFDIPLLQKTIAEAKNAPQIEFEDAGSIGKQIHDVRQRYFQNWIDTGVRPDHSTYLTDSQDPRIWSALRAVSKFCDDTGYIPVATEVLVYSEKLGLAGTLDDLGVMDGHLVLCDLKSSNQHKSQYFLQIALYYLMLKEITGLKPKDCFVLKVSKENGSYSLEYLKDMRKLVSYAKAIAKVNEGMKFINEIRKHDKIKL